MFADLWLFLCLSLAVTIWMVSLFLMLAYNKKNGLMLAIGALIILYGYAFGNMWAAKQRQLAHEHFLASAKDVSKIVRDIPKIAILVAKSLNECLKNVDENSTELICKIDERWK